MSASPLCPVPDRRPVHDLLHAFHRIVADNLCRLLKAGEFEQVPECRVRLCQRPVSAGGPEHYQRFIIEAFEDLELGRRPNFPRLPQRRILSPLRTEPTIAACRSSHLNQVRPHGRRVGAHRPCGYGTLLMSIPSRPVTSLWELAIVRATILRIVSYM